MQPANKIIVRSMG